MMHEAAGSSARRTPPPPGLVSVLRAPGITCAVRSWPSSADTAQLLLYQQARLPAAADLQRWLRELSAAGFRRVRTNALAAHPGRRVEDAGFAVVQELALLQHDDPRAAPAPAVPTSRLLVHQRGAASQVDLAAFGAPWALDLAALADVCSATPRHRARWAGEPGLQAYAITGRDARQGFLQRLAVHPSAQRRGLGLALVHDSLRWLARWRVQQVLVNTPTDNEGALALYRRAGFRELPERLRVYERELG